MATTQITKNIRKLIPIKGENLDLKTVHTKPNGAQTIRDILFRNTSGMSYDNFKTPYYEEQATFSSTALNVIQDMEPVEKLQFLSQQKERINTLTNKIQDFENKKLALENAQNQQETQVSE